MLESIFRRSSVRERIESNPIAPVLVDYIAYLTARGHGPAPLHQYVFAVEHYGRWLRERPIDHRTVDSFIHRHLPRCRCNKPCPRHVPTVRAALWRLLDMLQLEKAGEADTGEGGELLRDFEAHLRQACGLSETTISYRLRYARNLLCDFGVDEVRDLRCWSAQRIGEYVSRAGRRMSPSSGQVLACSIRSFLRFLAFRGFIERDLAAVVPSFAGWRLQSLPKTVGTDDLHRLVAAADPATDVGMRDRAILLCLTELALRAVEVAAIRWEDIDFRADVIRLRRPKQRDQVEVPMAGPVKDAIRKYLRRGRPRSDSKILFVKHRAPVGSPLKPIGIHGIVIRRAASAGLADQVGGTHVIRHSIASGLINSGASIKQIADLLGHESIDTTSIYAKVDLRSLRQVPLPWPASETEVLP